MKTWRNCASFSLIALSLAAPALTAPAPSQTSTAQPDRLTPGDAEVVVAVNVRQMLQTPVVKKHALDPLKLGLQRNDELRQLLAAAGLDPLKDIDTIALSTSGNPTSTGKLLVVVRGHFDPEKVRTASEAYAKKHPGWLKNVKEGELPMWEITSDGKSFFAAFADKDTLVMTTAKEETAAAVRRASQPPQPLNKDMRAALDRLTGSDSVWLAMVATDPIKQLLKGDDLAKNFADALQSVTGSLELTDDAQFTLVVHTNNPMAATRIKGKLDDLMPFLNVLGTGKTPLIGELIRGIKLETDKNDVSVRLKVTDAQFEKARKQGP
jgi:hypothetical protein